MTLTKLFPKILGKLFWVALAVWLIWVIARAISGDSWSQIFSLATWLPPIGMLALISSQLNLFDSIQRKKLIDIEARLYNLIHWLMFLTINIGVWMREGVSIWWFVLSLMLIMIIGSQVGVGLQNHWKFTTTERNTAVAVGILALFIGLLTGYARYLDANAFGWGWGLETIAAVVATLIVMRFISLDLIKRISKKADEYPRTVFLKEIFSNALVLIFWVHVMTQQGFSNGEWWLRNAGLSFNVLAGNAIYLAYYLLYEKYLRRQKASGS